MSHLDADAEKLLREGRALLRPTDADRVRVFQALALELGAERTGLLPSTAPQLSASTKLSGTLTTKAPWLTKAVVALVGVGAIGGGAWLMLREPPAVPTVPNPATNSSVLPKALPPGALSAPPAALSVAVSAVLSPTPPEPPLERKTRTKTADPDDLAAEVSLLSRAGTELHSGRPADALSTLAEHQRRFPSGTMTLERTAARVQALCALKRVEEARTEFSRLSRRAPDSLLVERARKACSGALGEK